jgi:hypothetical protein
MELICIFCQSKLFQVLPDAFICTNEDLHNIVNKKHWAYFDSINGVKVIDTINIVSGKYQLCAQIDTNNTILYEIKNQNSDILLKHLITIKDTNFIFHIKNEEDFMNKVKTLLLFM